MYQATHEKAIDHHVSALAKKLNKLHASLVATFWKDAELTEKAATDPKLTKKQRDRLLHAIEEMNATGYSAAIYGAQELLAEIGYTNAQGLTTDSADIDTGFDVAPKYVLDRLKDDSNALALRVVGREQDALNLIVTDAFENGSSISEVSDNISSFFDEGYHIDDSYKMPTDSWSEMVARTELSRAANLGAMDSYRDAGIQKVQWLATASACDECADADGEIVNLGDDFPEVDVDSPPSHPRCVCSLMPADEDLGSIGGTQEDKDRAMRGGYTADEYKQKFGFTHPIDQPDQEQEAA